MHEVLEALESLHRTGDTQVFDMCAAPVLIPALRERLAQPEQESERNKLAAWMMQRSYATGHGDTVDDLLKELEWQVIEREREACAKVCEDDESKAWDWSSNTRVGNYFARAIRARGNA